MWGLQEDIANFIVGSIAYGRGWRKGWDSNPRYPCRHAGFQDRCLKPLGHPSVFRIQGLSRDVPGTKEATATALRSRTACCGADDGLVTIADDSFVTERTPGDPR